MKVKDKPKTKLTPKMREVLEAIARPGWRLVQFFASIVEEPRWILEPTRGGNGDDIEPRVGRSLVRAKFIAKVAEGAGTIFFEITDAGREALKQSEQESNP